MSNRIIIRTIMCITALASATACGTGNGTSTEQAAILCRDTSLNGVTEPAILAEVTSYLAGVAPEEIISGTWRKVTNMENHYACEFDYVTFDPPAGGVDGEGLIACSYSGTVTATVSDFEETGMRAVLSYRAYGVPLAIIALKATWQDIDASTGLRGNRFCDINVTGLRQ